MAKKYYSLGVTTKDDFKILNDYKYNNILNVVQITSRYSDLEELKEALREELGEDIVNVSYVSSDDISFTSFDYVTANVKFNDFLPYVASKNYRIFNSFKNNYFNESFITGLLALTLRKYGLEKDYKAMNPRLNVSNDYELVQEYFNNPNPNRRVLTQDVQTCTFLYRDVISSNLSGVYEINPNVIKKYVNEFINNSTGNVFRLANFLYKFDRSVLYETNHDIYDECYEVDEDIDEFRSKDEMGYPVLTDFYEFYKPNKPQMNEEDYYKPHM